MQAMIYGIGPNPMHEELEAMIEYETDDFRSSPFNIYITDKVTWDQDHCCSDCAVDQKLREKLNKVGFAESEEGIFEPLSETFTKEQIHKAMEGLGFVHNKEFEEFMKNSFGE